MDQTWWRNWLRSWRPRGTKAGRKRRARLCLEPLEDRLTPATIAASAVSNLLNIPVQFTLSTQGQLAMTRGGVQSTIASGVQGLFQGHDSAGHQVAYELVQYVLREFVPNQGFVTIGSADQAAQDTSGDVFFRQGSMLLAATGVPAHRRRVPGHRGQ